MSETIETITLSGVFERQELTIQATRKTPNVVTAVILIGDPEQHYKKDDHCDAQKRRAFAGISFCHPKDEFDMLEGVKRACKHALEINGNVWAFSPGLERRKAIYRACRIAIRHAKDPIINIDAAAIDVLNFAKLIIATQNEIAEILSGRKK